MGRRGMLAIAVLVAAAAAAAIVLAVGTLPGLAGRSAGAGLAGRSSAIIRFISDQGVILRGPGSQYRLRVVVISARGGQVIREPVRWRSDDPAAVSVSPDGTVTAHTSTGSATVTVAAVGAAPQAAQVLVARPGPATELIPTTDVLAASPASVRLRRTAQTEALKRGQILVSNGHVGGGLLAQVVSVSAHGSAVTAVVRPSSMPAAFTALSVHMLGAPVTTVVPAGAIGTTAAGSVDCRVSTGAHVSVTLLGPGLSVHATVQLDVVLDTHFLSVRRFELALRATLPVTVTTGGVKVSAAGKATATCDLALPSLEVPTPVFLGPIDISGEVSPTAGIDASVTAAAALILPGPTLSQTTHALDGIAYASASGWQDMHANTTGPVRVTPGTPTLTAAGKTGLAPFLRVNFGVGATIAGNQMAGAALAYAEAKASYTFAIGSPLGRYDPGYTGPRWGTTLTLSGGAQADLTGDLAKLLRWIGLSTPGVAWPAFSHTIPVAGSPAITVTAAPGTPPNRVTRLSASLPAGYNGDQVIFVAYPASGGLGRPVTQAIVTGRTATATWTRGLATIGADTRIGALLGGSIFATAGFPYAAAAITVQVPQPVTVYLAPGQDLSYGADLYRPSTAQISADGTYFLSNMTWSTWTATTATGTGTALMDDCNPNCARGRIYRVPVQVTFSQPVKVCKPAFNGPGGSRYFWARAAFVYPSGVPVAVSPTSRKITFLGIVQQAHLSCGAQSG